VNEMADKLKPENERADHCTCSIVNEDSLAVVREVEFESLKPGDLVRFNYPGAGDAGLHRVTVAPYKIELSGGKWTWELRAQLVAEPVVKP